MTFLGTFRGEILPGEFYFSKTSKKLIFDKKQFQDNGVDDNTIALLEKILFQLPYHQCAQGCDSILMGYRVIFDKMNQSLNITDNKKAVMPQTTWGLVHNQSFNISAASNDYRTLSAEGQGYVGFPGQSFAYINWFYNQWHRKNESDSHQRFGSWYLQKNFSQTYWRLGQKNNLDASAGSIQTLTNPWLNQFITFGSQNYLSSKETDSEGTLVLYAISPGYYEIYRDDRLIRRIQAKIGRNAIDYRQLPAGYYTADVRLVDDTGREISKEKVIISNIDYQATKGGFITLGKTKKQKNLVQLGLSRPKFGFQLNGTVLTDHEHQWAAEGNISRQTQVGRMHINTTLGMMAGEKGYGHYARLNTGNSLLGYMSLSYYEHPYVSVYAPRQQSQYVSYSRHFGGIQIIYHWQGSGKYSQHQIQGYWQWNHPKCNIGFTVGAEKSHSSKSSASQSNNLSFFINSTVTFLEGNASIDTGYRDREWAATAQYQKEIERAYGKSILGITGTQFGKRSHFSGYVEHHGTRGNVSLRAGTDDGIHHVRFHYDGMFAMHKNGIAFGRRSNSGVALLVKTPYLADIPYYLKVEGSPVWGGHLYAVPISKYQDALFARAQNENTDIDMDIQLPVRITRAHPGQVFPVKAKIRLSLLYNGFLVDQRKEPISGIIKETGDTVYPNGLFSIHSDRLLKYLQVQSQGSDYWCDLNEHTEHYYLCKEVQ